MDTYFVTETYGVVPECLNTFNELYCAGSCSPFQSEFLEYVYAYSNVTINGTMGNVTFGNGTFGNETVGNNTITSNTTVFYVCQNFCQRLFDSCSAVPLAGNMTVKDIYRFAIFSYKTDFLDLLHLSAKLLHH